MAAPGVASGSKYTGGWFSSGITATEPGETCHHCTWIWFPAEKVHRLKVINAFCNVHGHGGRYDRFPAGMSFAG